jgi:hypothetical protein
MAIQNAKNRSSLCDIYIEQSELSVGNLQNNSTREGECQREGPEPFYLCGHNSNIPPGGCSYIPDLG